MHLHFDALGGIAGDMLIAAVLDARPEFADGMLKAIGATGLPAAWKMSLVDHHDHVLHGKRFSVDEQAGEAHAAHVPFREIARRIRESRLDAAVGARALAIFELLAQAEARVHGVAVDEVTFHEVGAWDSVADIVGAAWLLEALSPSSWSVGGLPLGGGRVQTAHGAMPVPAPATALLLEGFTFIDDGIGGERVTPTGAAILRHLRATLGVPAGLPSRAMILGRSGTGFGTKILPGISNVLRVLLFADAKAEQAAADDRVGVIQFEVDDQTAEDLAVGMDALRARAGVLDVLQMAAVGKKGRMLCHVQVLCREDALQDVVDACFLETTTIGLRWSTTARTRLDRQLVMVDAAGQETAVKVVKRPDGRISAKADVDDVRDAKGHRNRRRRRSDAEERALRKAALEEPCPDK